MSVYAVALGELALSPPEGRDYIRSGEIYLCSPLAENCKYRLPDPTGGLYVDAHTFKTSHSSGLKDMLPQSPKTIHIMREGKHPLSPWLALRTTTLDDSLVFTTTGEVNTYADSYVSHLLIPPVLKIEVRQSPSDFGRPQLPFIHGSPPPGRLLNFLNRLLSPEARAT